MKKFTALALALACCLFLLASCGKTKLKIDGKSFDFTYAHVKGEVRACGTQYAEKYSGTKTVDYTFSAADGKLTVTGEEGTYTGEYKVYKVMEESILYEINIADEPGFASLSERVRDDGTAEYELVLTIKGYYVNFSSEKSAE